MSSDSSITPDDRVEPLESEVSGVQSTDIPASDALVGDAEQPDSQGAEPLEAALGEEGQGDLAPGDEAGGASDPLTDDGPTDLRTEI